MSHDSEDDLQQYIVRPGHMVHVHWVTVCERFQAYGHAEPKFRGCFDKGVDGVYDRGASLPAIPDCQRVAPGSTFVQLPRPAGQLLTQ